MTFRDWRSDAACGPEMDFFPSVPRGNSPADRAAYDAAVAAAKNVCRTCPVILECLTYAIEENEIHGIWGGLTPKERYSLRREVRAS